MGFSALPIQRIKLHRPPPAPDALERGRLLEQLDQGLAGALTTITGPAGFGKSTLASQWVESAGIPAGWLSLDDRDNELSRFLSYFVSAIREACPDACPGFLGPPDDYQTSFTNIQLFATFLPGDGWAVGSSPILKYDWISEDWTIPLNLTVSKTVQWGETPFKLDFTLDYYVDQPEAFGPEWVVGFNVAPVVQNVLAGLFGGD